MSILVTRARQTFKQIFNKNPSIIVSAPGRINLIGEHTDYSNGFVLPMAINHKIIIALHPSEDQIVNLFSIDYQEKATIEINNLKSPSEGWQAYVEGITWALKSKGFILKGWEGVVTGDIPVGAGLSSSAAFEVAIAEAHRQVSSLSLSNIELAQLGQLAEIQWVGVNVGIMDQLISALGKPNHAVKLDCKTLEFEYIPIPQEVQFIVLDTKTRRELTNSAYNQRHEEVKLACESLGVSHLREANIDMLKDMKEDIDPIIYKRAHHVITENSRVHEFCDAMLRQDLNVMGLLINQSHESLKIDFEVSSKELNIIVDIARKHPYCLGARMTGAGFGGCAIAILKKEKSSSFIEEVTQAYSDAIGYPPDVFQVFSSRGVHVIKFD
jgi:galactokinase